MTEKNTPNYGWAQDDRDLEKREALASKDADGKPLYYLGGGMKPVLAFDEPEPLFWYRPCGDGLYEGPHHNNSKQGKMLREEKPEQWKPLYADAPQPAPATGVPWDMFPAWLIDHCEGDTITEEGLQHALAAMLEAHPVAAPTAHPSQPLDMVSSGGDDLWLNIGRDGTINARSLTPVKGLDWQHYVRASAAHRREDQRGNDPWTDLLSYVLQDDLHNRLTPRVIDIAYTAFMKAFEKNKDDGGPSDWYNDTRPVVLEAIGKLRKDLLEDRAAMQRTAAPAHGENGVGGE